MITCISLIILTSWMSTLVPYLQLQTPKHTHFIIRDQFSLEGYNTPVPKVTLKSFICSMVTSLTFCMAKFYVHNEGGFIHQFGCYRPAFWEHSEPVPLAHFHVEVKDRGGLDTFYLSIFPGYVLQYFKRRVNLTTIWFSVKV